MDDDDGLRGFALRGADGYVLFFGRPRSQAPCPNFIVDFLMRRVRYRVAASLDGYIGGPDGEIDWIVHDPGVDFASLYAGVDTVLLGRRAYELTR